MTDFPDNNRAATPKHREINMSSRSQHARFGRRHALAIACALALGPSIATASVLFTGSVGTNPGGLPIGPGDTDLGTATVYIGGSGHSSLLVDGGSQFTSGTLSFGTSLTSTASGLFDGAGTIVNLTAGFNRFEVGNWGPASVTVSGGATLNGRASAATCAAIFCGTFIGNAAGSDGRFTVTGAGSNASFLSGFIVGGAAVFGPPTDAFTFGTPGGVTRGAVGVFDGGSLTTDTVQLGAGPGGSQPLGTERTFASAVIDGPGSTWLVTGGTGYVAAAGFSMATHKNATATTVISGGGKLRLEGPSSQTSFINLGTGGRADMTVTGAGSVIEFAPDVSGVINVGRSAGAVATMSVLAGGLVQGLFYSAIGRDGGTGTLTVDGAGSIYRLNSFTTLAANTGPTVAVLDISRNGAIGTASVRNGGRIELLADTSRNNGPNLNIGRDAGSVGTLSITGADSTVLLRAQSVVPGGGPTEARNPFARVGRLGTGTLNVTAGGKLLLEGNAVSTVADSRGTSLYVGGAGDTNSGGVGVALVSGAGSQIVVSGVDPFIGVGVGAGATGQLTVADQGLVSATNINVGRNGGVGVVNMNNGRIELSGQQTGNVLAGAFLSVGVGGGSGIVNMSNGSVLRIDNAGGTSPAGFQLGGSGSFPTGNGIMTMSGGSRIEINGPTNLGVVQVGRDGVGILQMSASHIDVGATGFLQIGRFAGASGTMRMTDASTLAAQFVGVGRYRNADLTHSDGGVGLLNVSSGSSVTATDIVIGSKGVLSGDGTIIGNVTNYGVISPGNSPGTLTILGDYTGLAGSKLVLEIESDGAGGFNTDKLIFGSSSLVDLSGLDIEFQFLGATDPAAFLATGDFDVDNFLGRDNGAGGTLPLPDNAYAAVAFSGVTDAGPIPGFNITPNGTVTAVPEPQTYVMFGLGLAVLAWAARRRNR